MFPHRHHQIPEAQKYHFAPFHLWCVASLCQVSGLSVELHCGSLHSGVERCRSAMKRCLGGWQCLVTMLFGEIPCVVCIDHISFGV